MTRPPRFPLPRHRKFFPWLIAAAGMLAGMAMGESESSAATRSVKELILIRSWVSADKIPAIPLLERKLPAKKTPVSPPGNSHRLVVKFHDDLKARVSRKGKLLVNPDKTGKVAALQTLAKALKLRFRPIHTTSDETLDALRERAAQSSGIEQPDLAGTLEIVAANDSPAVILAAAKALLALDAVEFVEIKSLDAPPPPPAVDLLPTTPPLVSYQTYRGQSQGIGVDFAHDHFGIRGHPDLRITDCEYRFNPLHEDLAGQITLQPGVASMYSGFGDNHGTAAIGLLAAADNEYGMTGSAPLCQTHFYPEYATMDDGSTQFRAAAVTAAIAASAPGDIVVLEMQTRAADGSYCPAEYDMSVWNAVKTGTDAGVIVIAAAGNSACNLDSSSWAEYRSRGDSGAIIVGAGNSSRSKLSYSAYGSRVNLQGWGTGVASTGYGDLLSCGNDPDQNYTNTFNGTSSATAIVASAAALVQSAAIERLGSRLSPAEIRSLLVASGNPQTGDTSRPIGPLPDLTAAIPQLLARQFSNPSPIDIPDAGQPAAPPSPIQVSGVDGFVTSVRVRIDGLCHGTPQNLDLLLVSPDGKVAALMCDAGRSYRVRDAMLMFDDAAATEIPEYSTIVSGRYRPANHGSDQESPPPGTTGPIGTNLTALAANGANGEWKLYIADDHQGDTGSIAGWSISFETRPFPEVSFTTNATVASEGGEPTTITATLNEAAPVDVTVPFVLSGDACEAEDYQIPPEPIIIPAGQTSACTIVTPIDDNIDEADETIIITMGTPTHAMPRDATTETITLQDNDVTLTIESDAAPAPPSTTGDTYTAGTEITVTGQDLDDGCGTRHLCAGWTGSGSAPPEGQDSTATFVIQENSRIHWHHNTEHRLELAANGSGTVDTPSGWQPAGTTMFLTARPSPGHHFAGWTIDSGTLTSGTATDLQITVLMDQPAAITANFLPDLTAREAYEAWAASQNLPTTPGATTPGDGVPTLLKYAFNLAGPAPTQRSLASTEANAGLPCLTCIAADSAPAFRLEYLRRKNSGLVYSPMQMDDPSTGSRMPMTGNETVTDIDADWERVSIEQAVDPEHPRRFFTVEVTLPDS